MTPTTPTRAQLVVIRRCNLACAYCNEYDGHSGPISVEILGERLEHLRALGTRELELTGGEPLLHPEISRLIAKGRELAFERVMMITNGFLLSRELIESLNAAGLDALQVSVDGLLPNEVTAKSLRTLRPKLVLLERHARFSVTLNAVLGSTGPDDILEVISIAHLFGFTPRFLIRHDEQGQANLSAAERAVFASIASALTNLASEAHGYRAALLAGREASFKCRAGARYLYVDEAGIVRWCSQQVSQFGMPLSQYSHSDIRLQFETPKPCSDRCAIGCARTASAGDEALPQSRADRLVRRLSVTH